MPGVNNHGRYGRRAFAEFTDVYTIEPELEDEIKTAFDDLVESVSDFGVRRQLYPGIDRNPRRLV